METEIPIEELERVIRQLPPSRRREVLRFIEFLEFRDADETESLWQAVEVHQAYRAAHLVGHLMCISPFDSASCVEAPTTYYARRTTADKMPISMANDPLGEQPDVCPSGEDFLRATEDL